jgi:hypothetical protein
VSRKARSRREALILPIAAEKPAAIIQCVVSVSLADHAFLAERAKEGGMKEDLEKLPYKHVIILIRDVADSTQQRRWRAEDKEFDYRREPLATLGAKIMLVRLIISVRRQG